MTHVLEARELKLAYGETVVAQRIMLSFERAEIVSIIGPNGSGKSTVLKALARLLRPAGGVVMLDGKDLNAMPAKEAARIIAVLPQGAQAPGDMTVHDLVACGRSPYRKLFDGLSAQDQEIIQRSIEATGLQPLSFRRLDTLSGGERQRAWLAMALAQQPRILMLDEPTTYLDIYHQLELMKLIVSLHKQLKITVIMVLHDLNHAVRFSHRVIAVKDGAVFAEGPVADIMTRDILRELFGVETIITTVTQEGRTHLVCLPHDICLPDGA